MKFVVFGGTGNVGSQVTRELVARGHHVRIATRHPQKATGLGSAVEAMKVDLQDPYSLSAVYDGADGAFLVNIVSRTEAAEGLTAVLTARKTSLRRFVYLSVLHADRAPHLPHFGSKVAVEAAVQAAGIPWTILRPGNYFQNDLFYRESILQNGIYPQPIGGIGSSRVDVRDVAELAALALTQPGHEGKRYDVVGIRAVTGMQMAELWSKALGRRVRYAGDDLDAWEKRALTYMPAWRAFDFKHMYQHFHENGFRGSEQDVVRAAAALGHPPRAIEVFIAETAREWMKDAVPAGRS